MKRKNPAFIVSIALNALLLPVWVSAQGVSAERQFVETNGVTIAYRVIGYGEPLVLLHGFSGTGSTWDPIVPQLSTDYQLVIPELRGHGRSTNPTGIFTHGDAAADVLGLLDHLGISCFKAMGFSSGGMTLLHMATSQPERVTAMALIGATSYFPEQARRIMWSNSPDSLPKARLEAIGDRHGGDIEQARALMSQFHGFKDSYDDMNFTPPLLSTITARTLIVHGDRDVFFPVSIPVEQYEAIPDSYLMIIPNGGHVAFPSDPEGQSYFVATLRRFLADSWN